MEFVNETDLNAGWTLGFEPDGRELLVVVAKGTFLIPPSDEEPQWAEEQVPLVKADEFTGEPGLSSTLHETDYAHRKPRCDVLLNGSAYAADGFATTAVTVALQVSNVHKRFNVVGERVWQSSAVLTSCSQPLPFTRLPITYDRAYGGSDVDPNDPTRRKTYVPNPAGVGFYPFSRGDYLDQKRLPCTEEIGRPVLDLSGTYRPMAFGPVGRNVDSRVAFAGTYDKEWMEQRAPFWPGDFDYRYFQAAPADQQMSYPSGGEKVTLTNLTPSGLATFRLPRLSVPVLFVPHRGNAAQVEAVIDTVMVEPDVSRLMLTWRVTMPLRRSCFDYKEVVAGGRSRSWHAAQQAAEAGKRFYRGLDELVKERRPQADQ